MPHSTSPPTGADNPDASPAGPWTAEAIAQVTDRLARRGEEVLAGLDSQHLAAVWQETIGALRAARSPERLALESRLLGSSGLSTAGLAAALDTVLDGVAGPAATELFDPASAARAASPTTERGLVLVVLAANLPGLAAQPLLRLLASRRPALIKSASAEPVFAPALLRALATREPALGEAYAAVVWRGGDAEIEAAALRRAKRVVVYGDSTAIASFERSAPGRVEAHGPRASLAVVAAGADLQQAAAGLARDIALFDQRGCLSVQAVYAACDARALAVELAHALAHRAQEWPAGPIPPATAVAVQQLRADAELRGLLPVAIPLETGTVTIEPGTAFRASPGLRTVRIHPLPDLESLAAVLAPWRGRLQGVATAGTISSDLRQALAELGVTRIAPAGELQRPDALWDGLAPAAV